MRHFDTSSFSFQIVFPLSVPQVYPHKKGPPKCNFEKALYRSEEKSYSSL